MVACRPLSAVALAATVVALGAPASTLGTAHADEPPARRAIDPLAPIVAAARTADPGELERVAARVPPGPLAECVAKAARPRRMACIEASGFAPAAVPVLAALADALVARDRAVAVAAGAALERLVTSEAVSTGELAATELAPVGQSLARAAKDARLGADVRAAALHALTALPGPLPELSELLTDGDPVVRREVVAALARRTDAARALTKAAAEDPDDAVAAAAAAAVCETGHVSREVDARVRGWLTGPTLGPASLAPLLACARTHANGAGRAWLEAAARSPRPDVRALLAPPSASR